VKIRTFAVAGPALASATLVLAGLPVTGAAAGTARPAAAPAFRRACPAAAAPGWAECLALVEQNVLPSRDLARRASPPGYGPAQLQDAYNLALAAAAAGNGETVAVVDAFDDPAAAADLAVYRKHYHLPACGAGCFRKVNEEGRPSPLPRAAGTSGWATEESLDTDMVSAICPHCHILLVEADNGAVASLGKAVDAAVTDGAAFVSNSYSSPETPAEVSDDAAYFDHPGVAVTAAAGDSGYGVGYPAASRYVTSVGGTSLVHSKKAARGWAETVWHNGSGATGSGCSRYERKPAWQHDTGCAGRTDNDVAADADPGTGAAIYDSYDQGGWLEVGGTSESAPIIAATYALAGAPAAGTYPAQFPYQHTGDLYDITSGSDGSCGGSYLCTATVGYDGPTGWGTPDGTGAFQAVDHSVVVASPGARHSRKGARISPLRITAHDSDPAAALMFTATGLPPGLRITRRGVIYGRPRAAGSYLVRVHATDATGMTGSARLRWTVRPGR
jgi:Putative Ig domain